MTSTVTMSLPFIAQQFYLSHCYLNLSAPPDAAEAAAQALYMCEVALGSLANVEVPDAVQARVGLLTQLTSTRGLQDPNGEGLLKVKARELSVEDKAALSQLTKDLSEYFQQRSYFS
jgi:hypothetical protein